MPYRVPKTVLPISIVFLSLLVNFSCKEKQTQNAKPAQPNFLVILVDDLGYSDLGCLGSTYYETPNIDGLAAKGVTFTNGYAACQVCSPSRASIMSGKLPARHGITDYIGAKTGTEWRKAKRETQLLPPEYVTHLPHEYTTLPEALKEGGYRTFFAGKWHLGSEGSYPEDHGFDVNQGGYEKGGPYSGGYFSPFNNPKMTDYPEEKGMSLSMKLAKETSKFIAEHKESPFLAFLSFYAVHGPIQTTQQKWKKYRDKAEAMGIAETGFEMERRLPIRKQQDNPVYGGLIEQMDEAVGHVLETLKAQGLADNTVVIFTSDNGGVASGDNYSSNMLDLRGGKGYQWEGGIKVPFIVYTPWLTTKGTVNETPVIGTDLYPTLLDLAGLPARPQEHQDGLSLVNALDGKGLSKRPLYWHYPHYGNQGGDPSSVIRQGDWKLIHYWEDDTDELYRLKEDPSEQNDLAQQHPKTTQKLRTQLLEWLDSVGANKAVQDPEYSEARFKQKEAWFRDTLMPRLENGRKKMLETDWQPNADWWGSKTD
ncbi:sulfatase [Sediminicola luteus]|uniref:Sulfatase n=1 Tax=Sediminicola luteus TaxID=319238 RepID=A0A2A4G6T1_9FLAO|nr:sulfatase [Sediminicola luteus]PCE64679.1 sulfatase [Sediminicola luteus]